MHKKMYGLSSGQFPHFYGFGFGCSYEKDYVFRKSCKVVGSRWSLPVEREGDLKQTGFKFNIHIK